MELRSIPVARHAAPWVALLLPPCAWYAFEVGLATVMRISCTASGPWLGIAWGAGAVLLCGFAAWIGWSHGRSQDDSASRSWVARMTPFEAAIFALAIVYQTLATTIIPPCAR